MRPRRPIAGTRLTRWARVPRAWLWLALATLLAGQSAALIGHDLEHAHAVDAECVAYHVVVQPPLAAAPPRLDVGARAVHLLPTRRSADSAAPRLLLRPPLRAPPTNSLA
ncbi:hypothetical protein HUS23_04310 [Ectothiorhodospiraceae bacterium 2226]|nr:hypothetical protein HUS23_04310 [Ectothiorhodospiraceae bacterium 2226]